MRDEKAWKWLNENELSYTIWNNKYRYNNESFDEWLDRVSGKDDIVKDLILKKKFIFGGRTLANRGTNRGSMSNCYSSGYCPDDLSEIMKLASNLALTYKSQGGQGVSLSKLRPKGTPIGNGFESDGIVPFMEIFNKVTESISQGGSRKGALLMSLDAWHKEIETFITIKKDPTKIQKANLSVEIDDAFMEKATGSNEDVNIEKLYENHKVSYSINPRKVYNLICQSALESAEPGVIFTNRFRNYNLMELSDSYNIETCNPCGEQPLAKNSACNLSSINLSEYVLNPFTEDAAFDFDMLEDDMFYIVRAMDDVLEENIKNHPLEEQRLMAQSFRNLGIGIMGLHDAFIKMGIVYGSEESLSICKDIISSIFRFAVVASSDLAKDRGNFPQYTPKIWDSEIIKYNFSPDEIKYLKETNKLRNCSLLSIAPCGSVGTMLNVSTGCEPYFALHYIRNTKSLNKNEETSYEVWVPIAKKAKDLNWHPECLVTSNDISWKDHINIQAVLQNSVDTAISKTINMPKTTTLQDVKELYKYAWKKGLKGCTIYVDGSRDPILTTDNTKQEEVKQHLDCIEPISRDDFGQALTGTTYKHRTACGTLYITINKDEQGNIVEIFTNSSKNGTCKANLNGETRMASLALRAGVKVEEVIDQLKGIHCQSCAFARAKGNPIDGTSCPDIISKCIKAAYIPTEIVEDTTERCPECGQPVRHEGGCKVCSCGYSKCG